MREILRRAFLLLGLAMSLWLGFWSPLPLLRVEPIDWEGKRRRAIEQAVETQRLLGNLTGQDVQDIDVAPEAHADLATFIAHETEGRQIEVHGQLWAGFFNDVATTVLGRPPSAAWQARLARSLFAGELYFRVDEPPFDQLGHRFREPGEYLYLKIESEGRVEYLGVSLGRLEDNVRYAPAHLAYPYRHYGLWIFLGALLLYALIPWPRPPRQGLWYTRIRLMDALATGLVAVFFVLPFVITNANAYGAGILAEGWVWLTAVCWLLALVCATMYAIAAWYGTLRLELEDARLVYRSLLRSTEFYTGDVAQVDVVRQMAPKALRWALWIVALFNWRAAGQATLLSVPRFALRLTLRDGRNLHFACEGLQGIAPLVGRLHSAGAQVAPEVYELVELDPGDPAFSAPFPQARTDVAGPVILALLVVALGYGLYATRMPPTPLIQAAALSPEPFVLPTEEASSVTWEMLAEEQRILDEIESLSARLQEITVQLESASAQEREKLQAEAEQILARIEELDAEFARIRGETPEP